MTTLTPMFTLGSCELKCPLALPGQPLPFIMWFIVVMTITYCRESLLQQASLVESLKGRLHEVEANAKSFETLATERAHQIASLERECKVREERLSAVEAGFSSKEGKVQELETKMATSSERLATLQIEKERLSQQVMHIPMSFHFPILIPPCNQCSY